VYAIFHIVPSSRYSKIITFIVQNDHKKKNDATLFSQMGLFHSNGTSIALNPLQIVFPF
jgi:hypothetical protein